MSSRSLPRTHRRRLRAAIATLALVSGIAALAACGSDDGDSAGGGDKKTLRLAYQAFPSGDLIVKDQKWLETALPDWNIKWSKFDSGADINTAFIAG